jgi:pimeloyl-ACP methyl ester carboxylesterase
MNDTQYPVFLVHGWNSHPGIWNRLVTQLKAAGIQHYRFDYTEIMDLDIPYIASILQKYIRDTCRENGLSGPVDIVGHSLGSGIARYCLEVLDGIERTQAVRQLICVSPPHTGSALMDILFNPDKGKELIRILTGVLLRQGCNPDMTPIMQDMQTGSQVIQTIRSAGLRPDITYRSILSTNPHAVPGFFPCFEGKTWEKTDEGTYQVTLEGDGIVAYRQSAVPGISLDILPVPPEQDDPRIPPELYSHFLLPKNSVVIDWIMENLQNNGQYTDIM